MKVIFAILGFLTAAFVLSVILAIPVWLLWNWVCVDVLELKRVTLMQAWGISLLSATLFKPFSTNKDS